MRRRVLWTQPARSADGARLSGRRLVEQDGPEVIDTGKIDCQMHLASKANRPVRHWIELLDEALHQVQ
jgi:glycolate oxidase iron-sulfur subunit